MHPEASSAAKVTAKIAGKDNAPKTHRVAGCTKTFVMVKPDGVQRGLVGNIIQRFESKGLQLVALKMVKPDKKLLQSHYSELRDKAFYNDLLTYVGAAPVVAMCWSGRNATAAARNLIGATDPLKAVPGTIRGDLGQAAGRNLVHGADSDAAAEKELKLWFDPKELNCWSQTHKKWLDEGVNLSLNDELNVSGEKLSLTVKKTPKVGSTTSK